MHHVPWPKGPQIPEKWQGSALLFLLVATVLFLSAGPAQASYMERLASPVPGQSATAAATPANVSRLSQSHLIHLKGPKGTAPRLHSLGEDLPLAHALALLTPRGWLALGAHEAPMTRVSWLAKTPWLATLERIAQETNTLIILDWEEKTFTVQPYSDELYEKLTCRKAPDASSKALPASVSSPTPASPKPANKPSASTPMPSKAQVCTQEYDRPDLIVSHYAGPGRVYLARDMSVVEASRVLDTKITRLMAWNNLKDKKAVLRKGTLIWLTKPTAPKTPAQSTATATNAPVKPLVKPEAKAEARPKAQTASIPKPAPRTDVSVTRALATAQKQSQAQDKAMANPNKATAVPAQALTSDPAWSIAPGSLKAQVGSWASRAGYRVVWQADTDLHMAAGATFNGSFAEAVRALFEGLHEAGAPYTAHIFHGNNVLHIGDR